MRLGHVSRVDVSTIGRLSMIRGAFSQRWRRFCNLDAFDSCFADLPGARGSTCVDANFLWSHHASSALMSGGPRLACLFVGHRIGSKLLMARARHPSILRVSHSFAFQPAMSKASRRARGRSVCRVRVARLELASGLVAVAITVTRIGREFPLRRGRSVSRTFACVGNVVAN